MLKRILSVIAGASAGILIVIAGDMTTHFFFPIPEGIDHNDKEAMREMLTLISTSALIIMMAFWLLSSFIGAFVAAKINKQLEGFCNYYGKYFNDCRYLKHGDVTSSHLDDDHGYSFLHSCCLFRRHTCFIK